MKLEVIETKDLLWVETLQELNHDIYHLPEYVYLESLRTGTIPEAILIKDADKIFFIPYLLHNIYNSSRQGSRSTDVFDAISPYGYPGLLLSESARKSPDFITVAMDKFISHLRSKNICSAFLRLHPILNDGLEKIFPSQICQITGQTVSIDLRLSLEQIWQHTKSGHRNKINRCKRREFRARIVDFKEYLDEFRDIYRETMNRVKASESYYFSEFYFSYLAKELANNTHLVIVESKEGEVCCAGLFTECNGIVQYHLGGTKNRYLKEAPSKLMFDYVRYWAKERGNSFLHLGGGLGGSKDDNLFRFKAAFSKQRHTFLTLRLVIEEKKYLALTDLQARLLSITPEKLLHSGFFPAYRNCG